MRLIRTAALGLFCLPSCVFSASYIGEQAKRLYRQARNVKSRAASWLSEDNLDDFEQKLMDELSKRADVTESNFKVEIEEWIRFISGQATLEKRELKQAETEKTTNAKLLRNALPNLQQDEYAAALESELSDLETQVNELNPAEATFETLISSIRTAQSKDVGRAIGEAKKALSKKSKKSEASKEERRELLNALDQVGKKYVAQRNLEIASDEIAKHQARSNILEKALEEATTLQRVYRKLNSALNNKKKKVSDDMLTDFADAVYAAHHKLVSPYRDFLLNGLKLGLADGYLNYGLRLTGANAGFKRLHTFVSDAAKRNDTQDRGRGDNDEEDGDGNEDEDEQLDPELKKEPRSNLIPWNNDDDDAADGNGKGKAKSRAASKVSSKISKTPQKPQKQLTPQTPIWTPFAPAKPAPIWTPKTLEEEEEAPVPVAQLTPVKPKVAPKKAATTDEDEEDKDEDKDEDEENPKTETNAKLKTKESKLGGAMIAAIVAAALLVLGGGGLFFFYRKKPAGTSAAKASVRGTAGSARGAA